MIQQRMAYTTQEKQCDLRIRILPGPREDENTHYPGCGLIFKTHQDREKHEKFHCGNPESAYNNNSEPGIIDRRTPYGFGIPKTDMRYFNENVLFNANTQSWNFLNCDYTRDKYQWYQVFGHVAATHGYTSRIPNERWGIQIQDKYQQPEENPGINLPGNLKPYMREEINNRRIHIRINADNNIMWGCGYCQQQYAKEKGVTTHIGKCIMKQNKETNMPLLSRNLPQSSQP